MVFIFTISIFFVAAGGSSRQSIGLFLSFIKLDRGAPDEGRREAPGDADEDEGEYVVERGGGWFGGNGRIGVHGKKYRAIDLSYKQHVS